MAPEQDPTYRGEISPTNSDPLASKEGPRVHRDILRLEGCWDLNGTDENQACWSTGVEFESQASNVASSPRVTCLRGQLS